jgi:cytochrome c peroxidase
MTRKVATGIMLLLTTTLACTNKALEPEGPAAYVLDVPDGFPDPVIPEDNPMTEEGVALGRMLYYDSILHRSGTAACATCHIQQHSFTSDGNVLPHINLAWSHNFLWDGSKSGSLEEVMLFEVEDFFGTDISKLQQHPEYPDLFAQAFGTGTITSKEVAYALAQFFRILNSGDSKFDKFLRNEAEFTNQEYLGFDLFFTEKGDCFHCHATAFFTDNIMHNNALDAWPDPGYFLVTGDSLDYGKFKSPTLRNIEYTGPYMHDSRYATLEEVVDFYSEGLEYSPTVDPLMKNLSQGGVQLSVEEKAALVAFLRTLSDPGYLTNPDLSLPAKN